MPKRGPAVPAIVDALREQLLRMDLEAGPEHDATLEQVKVAVATVNGNVQEPTELSLLLQVLSEQGSLLSSEVRFLDVGTVQNIGDGVATLSGLPRARTDEIVHFSTGVRGMVLNLDRQRIDVILLGPDVGIRGGDLVTGTGRRLRVPVGRKLLGRVLDPLGRPLDDRGPIQESEWRHVERSAPGIIERAPVSVPLQTGIKIVDALVPIGRGQRELIIGDRQIGKTSLAVDTMISQLEQDVICVYVAIGQKKSSSLSVIETLRQRDVLSNAIVVVSSPDDPPALRYLAPYAGCTMAELFVDEGHDVLVIYDDLSKHADSYRELSLLLRRPPGREAYPGDIFYLHARLLERACRLTPGAGGGSLTALPIVETRSGNISAYIPTNIIAITDGQIVLSTELFNRGIKPAVDVGFSVSRVGGAAQAPAMREIAGNLRLELSQFEEVSQFARFGAELDESTRQQIRRGERLRAILSQPPNQPLGLAQEIIILLAATEGFLDPVELSDIPALEQGLVDYVLKEEPDLYFDLDRKGMLADETRDVLHRLIATYLTLRSAS